jgi:hypothetical protein
MSIALIAVRRKSVALATTLLLTALALLTTFAWTSSAQAKSTGAYPPPQPCVVSILGSNGQPLSSFQPGESLTVIGSGFTPNAVGQIILESTPINIGTAKANAGGSLSEVVHVPATLPLGAHTLLVVMPNMTCSLHTQATDAGVDSVSATKVTAKSDGDLASTGFEAAAASAIAVALIGGGIMFVLIGRRRRV